MALNQNAEERLISAISDRYRIEGEIGRGGMATVYLAQDLKHDRQVAVKVLDPDLAQTLGAIRFLREIKTTASLAHPNILPVFDSGEAGKFLFYVMPFVQGETLRTRLTKERQLPIEDAIQITRKVADALAHAHGKGIIHRDVKPANIMLEAGHAVLADFGVARAVAEAGEDRITQTGTSLGTPTYMSPEQTTGEHDLDGRSDQYSLGCVLYEMLAGEPPYTGPTPQAVFAKRLTEPVPHVSTLRETIPQGVEEAITRALAKAPADRFSTTDDFIACLTTSTGLSTGRASPDRSRKVRRGIVLGMVGVFSVGVLATVVMRGLGSPAESAGPGMGILAVLPCANQMGDPDQEHLAAGLHVEILTGLGKVPGIEVRGRTSVMRYQNTDVSLPEMARELGVGGLVECSISRVGDSFRVSASLLDALHDRQFWSEAYQRTTDHVFLLGSDVALGIAEALRANLTPTETNQVEAQSSENQEALSHYYRGLVLMNQWTEEPLRRSIEYFEEAIALDSTFALAFVGMAEATMLLGDAVGVIGDVRPVEYMPEAQQMVRQALELDNKLSDAHRLLGWIRWLYEFDYSAGEEEAREATELDQTNAGAWANLGFFLAAMGRFEEGITAFRRAIELDPAEPWILSDFAWALVNAREYQEALRVANTAIELDPGRAPPYLSAGDASLLLGRNDEALDWYDRGRSLSPHPWNHYRIGIAHAAVGNKGETLRLLGELKAMQEERYVQPRAFTGLYLALDSLDAAIEWAIEAAKTRDPGAQWEVRHPFNDRLKDHPRYPELLRLLRLER